MIDSRDFVVKDHQMNKFVIAILSLTLPLSVLAAEGFSSLEEQMSGKEFTTSGLNKLTPAELDNCQSVRQRTDEP